MLVILVACRTPWVLHTLRAQTKFPRRQSSSIDPLVVVAQGISSAISRASQRNRTKRQLIAAPVERSGRRILVGGRSLGAADWFVVLLIATPELNL
jgi:hypothetical protein